MLIVASLAVDLVLLAWLVERSTKWPDLFVAATLGLAGGQINLATLWSILGCRHLPWRIATLFVVPLAWAFAITASAPEILRDYDRVAVWGVHFLTQSALLVAILVLVRLSGATLLAGSIAPPERPRRQFSLRYLFAWLTSTAIAMSALKTTFDHANLAETAFDWRGILSLGFVSSTLGLSSIWIVLDTRSRSNKLAATWVTTVPAVLVAVVTMLAVDKHKLLAVLLICIIAGLYSAIAWHVLSVAGFRLVWLKARNVETPTSPPQ